MPKKKARKDEQVNPGGLEIRPLLDRPEKVAIVALGRSSHSYIAEVMSDHGMKNPFDEVWGINRALRGFVIDKLFCMDDFRWLEARNENYSNSLRAFDKPIITSTVYPEYPMSVEYPLQEVIQSIGDDVFAVNSVSYAVAYAIHIGVKEMSIYGADFSYPNGNTAESGGQAVAYLLGIAKERGIQFRLPANTTMLYANETKQTNQGMVREYYGYHRKAEMEAGKA